MGQINLRATSLRPGHPSEGWDDTKENKLISCLKNIIYISLSIYIYIHTHVYVYTYIYIYIYIHTRRWLKKARTTNTLFVVRIGLNTSMMKNIQATTLVIQGYMAYIKLVLDVGLEAR